MIVVKKSQKCNPPPLALLSLGSSQIKRKDTHTPVLSCYEKTDKIKFMFALIFC